MLFDGGFVLLVFVGSGESGWLCLLSKLVVVSDNDLLGLVEDLFEVSLLRRYLRKLS
jgi:hypothetical protein